MARNQVTRKVIDDRDEADLRDTKDQVMTTDMEITWPDDTGSHIYKTTDVSTTLTIVEGTDAASNKRLPNLIIISTEPGASDITLASDAGNTLSVEFRYQGAEVDTLPGDGYFSYGLRLKPGTSSYIVDAKGGVPYLFEAPVADPVRIAPATVFTFGTNQNDPSVEPLSATYNLDMGSYNDPTLWVIAWGSGGGGKTAYTGATAGGVAMNKAFDSLNVVSANFVKHIQAYMLPDASAPADGNVTVTIGEDATSVNQNRGMIVFVVENSSQAVPDLLSVTGSDSSRSDIRYVADSSNISELSLGVIAGEHLAVSVFTTNADAPASDGDNIADVTSVNWVAKLASKNGEDQALGFTCSTATTGGLQHLVFAIEKVAA